MHEQFATYLAGLQRKQPNVHVVHYKSEFFEPMHPFRAYIVGEIQDFKM